MNYTILPATLRLCLVSILVFLIASPISAPLADDNTTEDFEAAYRQMADDKTRAFLNDLSTRRRVTTLFANKQSLHAGVQENFVNTSRGNLTFLIRDLVRIGGLPIILGRVYDSTFAGDGDFGFGWKLTVSEQIVTQGAELEYTDTANVTHSLQIVGMDIIAPVNRAMTPIRIGVVRQAGRIIELHTDDLVRRFEKLGETYRLVKVTNQHDHSLHLSYTDGKLVRVSTNTAFVDIGRDVSGQIVVMTDDIGREVRYRYDAAGMLIAVDDLAGETWRYRYDGGTLIAIDDSRPVTILEATYDNGLVRWVRALRQETTFHYDSTTTRAVDALGRSTTFHRTQAGLTDAIADATGSITEVTFDDSFRPQSVTRDGLTVARLFYDTQGRLIQLSRPDGNATFTYNRYGVTTIDSTDSSAEYRYDVAGRLILAADNKGNRAYEYHGNGTLQHVTIDNPNWPAACKS